MLDTWVDGEGEVGAGLDGDGVGRSREGRLVAPDEPAADVLHGAVRVVVVRLADGGPVGREGALVVALGEVVWECVSVLKTDSRWLRQERHTVSLGASGSQQGEGRGGELHVVGLSRERLVLGVGMISKTQDDPQDRAERRGSLYSMISRPLSPMGPQRGEASNPVFHSSGALPSVSPRAMPVCPRFHGTPPTTPPDGRQQHKKARDKCTDWCVRHQWKEISPPGLITEPGRGVGGSMALHVLHGRCQTGENSEKNILKVQHQHIRSPAAPHAKTTGWSITRFSSTPAKPNERKNARDPNGMRGGQEVVSSE